jgi:hypothetical protein
MITSKRLARDRDGTPKSVNPLARLLRRVPPPVYFGASAAILAALVPLSIWFTQHAARETERADGSERVVSAAAPAVFTLDDLCRQQGDLGDKLRSQTTLCPQAGKAKAAISDQPPPAVPIGNTLTTGQVQDMITNSLAGLPRPLTIDQVAAKATEVYTALDAATPSKISAAVATLCANDACRGQKGDDAPPVTDAQILAQVNAYCARDDRCVGKQGIPGDPGKQGDQGVSVVDQRFIRDDQGGCRSQVTLSDGRTLDGPAGDAACSPAAVPPATSASATPGGLLSGG